MSPSPIRRTCTGQSGPVSYLSWSGPSHLAPLVLLHPVNTAAAIWAPLMDRMGNPGLAVDYRGHGASGRSGPFRPSDYACDTLAVLDHAAVPAAIVVGASVGGAIAVELAHAARQRVLGIVLLGASVRFGIPTDTVDEMVAELHRLGTDEWFASHAQQVLGPGAPPGIAERVVELAGGRAESLVARVLRATFHDADSRLAAEAVRDAGPPPSLVVTGSHDPTCPPSVAHDLAEYLGCQAVVMPDVGHLPMLEAPNDTAALVTDFLRTIAGLHSSGPHK